MPAGSSPMLQSYSEFLASSFGNFTQSYFADHSELWSHDQINRQLRSQKWTPRSLRQYLRNQIPFSHQGYLLFDDTVLDKRHSHFIEMVRRQWSGNAHAVIPGIGGHLCLRQPGVAALLGSRFSPLRSRARWPQQDRSPPGDVRPCPPKLCLFDPGRLDGFVVRQQEGDQSDRGGPQGLLLPSQAEPTGNTGPGNALPTTGYSTLR